MKPYPKYKDSGVEWIGEVPAGWNVVPLKHLAEFINGDAFKPTEWAVSGTPIIRIQNLNGGEDFNYYAGEVEQRYLVYDGDLLFGWSGNRGTSFGPFLWTRKEVCVLNQHIFRVIPNSADKRSLFWMLKAATAHVEDQAHGIIGMVHVTKGALGAISVPLPRLPEQIAIAAFLDRETARLDALIAKYCSMIDLLREKRQAMISRAVTKGLDPTVAMKDSGVEWLGEVPAGWRVGALKLFLDENLTYGANESADHANPEDPRYIRITDVDSNGKLRPDTFRSLPPEIAMPYMLKDGDILLARSGATVGKTFLYRDTMGPCCFAGYLIRARFSISMTPNYANFFFSSLSYRAYIDSDQIQSTIQNVSAERYGSMVLPCPSIAEQQSIATFLDRETAKIDTLIQSAEKAITLTQERRSALISAAVTGRIDCRSEINEAVLEDAA
ncbi:restriction endonuclease subunit S [Acidiphilium acidophilum]|uniref:restriction endonuclease subunit S n=1 Tax=Acidiphilium acidophilum TaxID=76588 RepID=UPI002E8E7913|nr:restriction endonuclease subunit S [Acidiphilium acidophilum]